MKPFFLSLLLCSCLCFCQAETAYKLSEAIQKKLVNVKFTGAKDDTAHMMLSSHYGPCISMEITSASADNLSINLEYGYLLMPDDSSTQAMMVTQSLVATLNPKQKKNYRLYAMCTEANDGSPGTDDNFKIGKRTAGNLLGLAELLNRKKYQNDAGQDAVWCFTNNHDVHSIYSVDTAMMYELRRFVAKAKNLPIATIYENQSDPIAPVTYTTHYVYSGSLSYSLAGNHKVLIALFDEDNHMKKVYVNNENQREGVYTYNYELSSDEMSNKKHYLRMFRDGKMEEEITILPQD